MKLTSIFRLCIWYKIYFYLNFFYFHTNIWKYLSCDMKFLLLNFWFWLKMTSAVFYKNTFICFIWKGVLKFLMKTFLINQRGVWKATINEILGISSGISLIFISIYMIRWCKLSRQCYSKPCNVFKVIFVFYIKYFIKNKWFSVQRYGGRE